MSFLHRLFRKPQQFVLNPLPNFNPKTDVPQKKFWDNFGKIKNSTLHDPLVSKKKIDPKQDETEVANVIEAWERIGKRQDSISVDYSKTENEHSVSLLWKNDMQRRAEKREQHLLDQIKEIPPEAVNFSEQKKPKKSNLYSLCRSLLFCAKEDSLPHSKKSSTPKNAEPSFMRMA